jgi:hypothetical protein
MLKWFGRGKRIEDKLDELLAYYGPRPAAGATPSYTPPGQRIEPILMTDEREERIMKQQEDERE